MEYFIVVGVLIAICGADISLKKEPPYKPSGWRPSGPLPGEYGAPPIPASVQVSQENLRFAGQSVEVTTAMKPKIAYLPPPASQQRFGQLNAAQVQQSNNAFLRVQNVPRKTPWQPFRSAGQFNPILPQTSPIFSEQHALFAKQQQLPSPEISYGVPADPNNQYGPPPSVQFPPEPETETETPEETVTESTTADDPVIAIANAGTNGQYYILSKDNTLQRVVFTTTQTDDDRLHDGFSAQLRYEPVEPIQDPVYAYDAQGQLIRIYNKK